MKSPSYVVFFLRLVIKFLALNDESQRIAKLLFFWGCHLLVHTNERNVCWTLSEATGDDTKCSQSFCSRLAMRCERSVKIKTIFYEGSPLTFKRSSFCRKSER